MIELKELELAVRFLREGKLVAIPTETVYGLAADAENPGAVAMIYTAKHRPVNHPLIVHVADAQALESWASEVPPAARALADAFWPGPLTMILKRSSRAKDFVTGGQDTVALRCPSHPDTHELLKLFGAGKGNGLAAPSANSFGKISPTTAIHVKEDLGLKAEGGSVDLILDGGSCEVGIESTILDLTGTEPRILREGAITSEMISRVLEQNVLSGVTKASPRVSGSLKSHYAPDHPLEVVDSEELIKRTQFLARHFKTFGIIAPVKIADRFRPVSEKSFGYEDSKDLAKNLYEWMHQLDKLDIDKIFVLAPEYSPDSAGVLDRLKRASAKKD